MMATCRAWYRRTGPLRRPTAGQPGPRASPSGLGPSVAPGSLPGCRPRPPRARPLPDAAARVADGRCPASPSCSRPRSPPSAAPGASGQDAMAQAVRKAIASGEHLAVQAGTGTGKSLAYLVPAIRHAVERGSHGRRLDRDDRAAAPARRPRPAAAGEGAQAAARAGADVRDPQGPPQLPVPEQAARRRRRRRRSGEQLFDPFAISALGPHGQAHPRVGSDTETGDRDELVPGVPESAWRQVSVSARECLGASRCPVGDDCFAEKARAEAGRADVVVTNHALLAIDALEGRPVLPEHDVVIVDEAHELVDRVTGVATAELTAGAVTAAARRCGKLVDQAVADRLVEAGEGLALVLDDLPPGALGGAAPAGGRRAVRGARRRGVVQAGARRRAAGGPGGRGGPQGRAGRAGRGRRHRVPPAQRLRRAGPRAPAATSCGWPSRARTAPGAGCCGRRRSPSAGCCGSGCSGAAP